MLNSYSLSEQLLYYDELDDKLLYKSVDYYDSVSDSNCGYKMILYS